MKLEEILNDAVGYPFLGIKNVFILGIINFIGLYIGFTSVFLNGYQFRIIKSSLNGDVEPPEFNNWVRMLLDGVKVYLVGFVYTVPALLIIIIFGSILISSLYLSSNTPLLISTFSVATIVVALIAIVYLIISIPIIMMAIAHMANNDSKLSAAFRFREILDKIASLGWMNFIKWSIVTIIPVVIITIAAIILTTYISIIIQLPIEKILIALILAPLFMYLFRSVSLFYKSGGQGYLECENCGGYYKLQPGESPDDFDKCECGGKLNYTQNLSSNDESDDVISDKSENTVNDSNKLRSLISFNNTKFLILITILSLTIIAIPFLYSTHALTPTPIKYTLLGSYNVDNLGPVGKAITIPQGTKNIKIVYNISWKTEVAPPTNGLILDTYNTDIGKTVPPGARNIIDNKGVRVDKGQNKTGTYYFNNPEIKSLAITGYGIQGTVKIYTSQ